MREVNFASLFIALFGFAPTAVSAVEPFQLRDGDRVVFLGSTLIEREQRYGFWETMLTSRNPGKTITFRNLGWSGDTVFAEARAEFGTAVDGFRRMQDHVYSLKPTVVFVAYGSNESFDGPAGLPQFRKGLDTLLDTLAKTKARIVLLSPLRHARMPAPLSDPGEHNRSIALYRDVIRELAKKRGLPFVDLFELFDGMKKDSPLIFTDNGIHLTGYGYCITAHEFSKAIGLDQPRWKIAIEGGGKVRSAEGVTLSHVAGAPLRFQATDAILPEPCISGDSFDRLPQQLNREMQILGLAAGVYTLKINQHTLASGTAAQWAAGMNLEPPPSSVKQMDKLRQTVIEKNLLYFHRWRPQNDTYLFGFRKQEQGNNAIEIPRFDPLIEKLEAAITKLRVPVAQKYELIQERNQ